MTRIGLELRSPLGGHVAHVSAVYLLVSIRAFAHKLLREVLELPRICLLVVPLDLAPQLTQAPKQVDAPRDESRLFGISVSHFEHSVASSQLHPSLTQDDLLPEDEGLVPLRG